MIIKIIMNNEELNYNFSENWYYECRLKKYDNIFYGYLAVFNKKELINDYKNLILFLKNIKEKELTITNIQLYDDEQQLLFDSNILNLIYEHTELAYIQPNNYKKNYTTGLMYVIRFVDN